jgi:hypothetical protein
LRGRREEGRGGIGGYDRGVGDEMIADLLQRKMIEDVLVEPRVYKI